MSTAYAIPRSASPAMSSQKTEKLLNLLIVDDDRFVREACREAAIVLGYSARATESIDQALWLLESQNFDVVFLSAKATDFIVKLHQLKEKRPGIEVIAITNNESLRIAVDVMKAGAYDVVAKPFGLADVRLLLEDLANHLKAKGERRLEIEKHRSERGFANMVGHSPKMEMLYRMIGKAARTGHPVLITGESGTGKEMVAKALHYAGPCREKPFIPVDCGSLVPSLIESELFGYVKGAFTGAIQAKPGLLTIAEGGTVFLDEVGELPLDLQSKLLRALQEREIRPVGGTKTIPIDVRILAATNRDLEQAVAQGAFRQDLYFRLNVLSLRVPPLRERHEDTSLLVERFLERLSRDSGRHYQLSEDAMKALSAYHWPGNVRELENCIERACAMNSGPVIHVTDLPECITRMRKTCANERPNGVFPLAELERQAILGAIERLNGDKVTAAKLLGIGKTTLYRKLKEYGAIRQNLLPKRTPHDFHNSGNFNSVVAY
jgi:DNA-binding NtrC family response regulator